MVLIKEPLALYTSSYSKVNILPNVENDIISRCIKLLKPFEEITKKISASTASVYDVIPLISTLTKHFEPSSNEKDGLKRMKDVIKLKLEKRFGSVEINDLHAIASYLDHRYKGRFLETTILEQVKSSLCVAVEKLQSEQSIDSPPI